MTQALPLAASPTQQRGVQKGFAPKELAKSLLASGLPYAFLRMRALRGRKTTILCYHTLRPDAEHIDAWTTLRVSDFVQQVAYLRANYDVVSLDDALAGTERANGPPRVVLTFDDGEVGLYDSLLPLVSELRLPVTLYIATGQIENGRAYWFDDIMNALQSEGPFRIDLGSPVDKSWTIGPARGAARWAVISDILETLKGVPPEQRAALAAAVVEQAPLHGEPAFKPLQPLSIAQLAELSRSEWVTIGAHSHCHSLLDQIPIAETRASVARSRALLEEWTGKPVRHFAYPNGNHNAQVEAAVADAGFHSATVTEGRLWRGDGDRFALPRVLIGRYDDFVRFKLRLAEV